MYLARGGFRNRFAKEFHDLFCHQHWNIGYVEQPIQAFLEEGSPPPVMWFPLKGKGSFLADSFGIVRDGRTYIFCEELDYPVFKGKIARIEIEDDGGFSQPRVVMDMPFHMTYPYVFEFQRDVYCVPETYQAGEISLFKAEEFPDRWTKVATLVPDFPGVDSSIFNYQGRWWLIGTRKGATNEKLYAFYAPSLLGPWRAHARNPVKSDMSSARSAGTPFLWKGSLYRPAMDNSKVYGKRIVINRVRKLTPTEFDEEPVRFVEPARNGRFREGIHTLSSAGDITVVDGFRVVFQTTEFRFAAKEDRRRVLAWVNPLLHPESKRTSA